MNGETTKLLHELIHTKDSHAQAMHEMKQRMDEVFECVRLARIALSRDPNTHNKHNIIDYKLEQAIEILTGGRNDK